MLDFQPLQKEKIEEYKTYYDYTDALGCERNFVNGYLWYIYSNKVLTLSS